MKQNIFNIRVYGIMVNEERKVLVSDEQVAGIKITKFPGGGLEFGEGTHDCLHREFREELASDIIIISHFYTTDFFQPSFLNDKQQVVSIYYLIKMNGTESISVSEKPFSIPDSRNEGQSFRWLSIADAEIEDISLPIDRKVLSLLKSTYLIS